jgi:BolA protein
MTLADTMRSRLTQALSPAHLEIIDDSELHRGHAGFREGGESHWRIHIRAETLGPMSRLERHRAIHAALGADIVSRIHALELKIDV